MHHGGEGEKELLVSLEGIMEHKRMDFICYLTTHFTLWSLLMAFRVWECWENTEGSIPDEVHCLWICPCCSCRVLSSKTGQTWKPGFGNWEAWSLEASRAASGAGCHWDPEELSWRGAGMEGTASALHWAGLWRARKVSVSQDDVSNENRRNLLVTTSQDLLVYSRGNFIFACELRAIQWGIKRRSQIILQSSSVKGVVVILKEVLSHLLLRHSLKVNMQIHLRSAVFSSLVLWAFFLNQRAIVQALCWGRTKYLIFFFFITMSAFPSDWGLQLFQN